MIQLDKMQGQFIAKLFLKEKNILKTRWVITHFVYVLYDTQTDNRICSQCTFFFLFINTQVLLTTLTMTILLTVSVAVSCDSVQSQHALDSGALDLAVNKCLLLTPVPFLL